MVTITWDYTKLANTYDQRADYSIEAINRILRNIDYRSAPNVCEIGAGTGKLTVQLSENGVKVVAIEPNDAMRSFGIKNTAGLEVIWKVGTGEQTGMEDQCCSAVLFGSSFNVVDQLATLNEVSRILKPNGRFVCLWNHRDLSNPLQIKIEEYITRKIPNYSYGKRRLDPTEVILESQKFKIVESFEESFTHKTSRVDFMDAWASHGTLANQSGEKFQTMLGEINKIVPNDEFIDVPFHTRVWVAQKI